jgi:SAM-dependent methyltransferase
MKDFFVRLKEGTEELNYGREIISAWGAEYIQARIEAKQASVRAFDIGCGEGQDLINVRTAAEKVHKTTDVTELELYGIEHYPPNVESCTLANIKTYPVDIEREEYPAEDNFFDVVIANQVLEHTKEIFWIFAEVTRILKPGGRFIIGVPNLASLHNRILLLLGQQPTAQISLSAHVRTFTRPDFQRFVETGGYFRTLEIKGSNFYPFAPSISRPLSQMFPSMAWGLSMLLERTDQQGSFLDCLYGKENFLETPYFGGPQNPPPRQSRQQAVLR